MNKDEREYGNRTRSRDRLDRRRTDRRGAIAQE